MEEKTANKKELLKTSKNGEFGTDNSDFFKKMDLGIGSSMVSGISKSVTQTAFEATDLQSSLLKACHFKR